MEIVAPTSPRSSLGATRREKNGNSASLERAAELDAGERCGTPSSPVIRARVEEAPEQRAPMMPSKGLFPFAVRNFHQLRAAVVSSLENVAHGVRIGGDRGVAFRFKKNIQYIPV